MRIIGGRFRGRTLATPRGMETRPTADMVRENIFNILIHRGDVILRGARVIDLFAGSGALGLEAISRGASFCLFVDESAQARAAIRQNAEALNLFGATTIHRRSATALGEMPASDGQPFSLAFLDAPYNKFMSQPALTGLRDGGWLSPRATCIVEQAANEMPAMPDGFVELDRRIYGETQIGFLRFVGERV